MNWKTSAVCITIVLSVGGFVWLYAHTTRYIIVSQRSYSAISNLKQPTMGYAVKSPETLREVLLRHGLSDGECKAEQQGVNFEREFVFVVENGTLLEMYRGNSGFDIAAVKSSTNFSVAVIHGPKSRPLKTVGR